MDIKTDWDLSIDPLNKEARNAAVDREVERYSKWLASLKDSRASGPLNNPEKALIKTYLVQKLNGSIDEVT